MKLLIKHPNQHKKLVVTREELEIAKVVFGKLPTVITVILEKGIDYLKGGRG